MTVHPRSRARPGWGQAPAQGIAPTSAQTVRPLEYRVQPLEALMIAGLAGVFLVNAIVAVFEPSDFTGLVERSLVGRTFSTMSGRWVAWAIAVHDSAVGVLLVATMWIPRPRPFVL